MLKLLVVRLMTYLVFLSVESHQQLTKTILFPADMSALNGSVLCATSSPSSRLTLNRTRSRFDCAMRCLNSGFTCYSYNYRTTTSITTWCDIYATPPTMLQPVTNCSSFKQQIPSCQSSPSGSLTVTPSPNCSYPFTYQKIWYNYCVTGMPNVTSNCAPYACFEANRTATLCSAPDFVAKFFNTNVTVGNLTFTIASINNWIVILNRLPPQTPGPNKAYNQTWQGYKNGFGLLGSDYWFGLEKIYQLTNSAKYKLRVEIKVSTGEWYSAEYWTFFLGDELTSAYQINLDGYSGDAGNAFNYSNNPFGDDNQYGAKFSTYETINHYCQLCPGYNCIYPSPVNRYGWWWNNCNSNCLTCSGNDFIWKTLSIPATASLESARMMIQVR